MFLSLAITLIVLYSVTGQDGPIVDTLNGPVQGFIATDHKSRAYDGFLGIPFAQPPVGPLRWARPVAPDSWTELRNSTWWRPHCIQPIAALYPAAGMSGNESEDCLYLNVYVPVSLSDALATPRPVMFFIFGGAYQFGTAEMYPGEELATQGDVVVVNFNYRTGMMGFLTTADAAAAGNWGLWDTKAALEWVVANIASFGGDPQKITVFGQSAGGASVMHVMHSLQTNTLFHNGIAMSGTGHASTAINDTAMYAGGIYGCDTTDSQNTIDCLRLITDGKELVKNVSQQAPGDGVVPLYAVVVDNYANPGEIFLDLETDESWEQGRGSHINFVGGSTFHDYAGFATGTILGIPPIAGNDTNYNEPNTYWYNFWVVRFSMYENTMEIVDALYEQFPDLNSTDDAVATETSVRIQTDLMFGAEMYNQNEKHAEAAGTGSTYHYIYKYALSFLGGRPEWCEGSHMDDIYSILGESFLEYVRERLMGEFNPDDTAMADTVMGYYSNFAYSGDPNVGPRVMNVVWPRYDLTNREFILESVPPVVVYHTQELQDHFNWFLIDLPALMIPRSSGDSYTELLFSDYVDEFLHIVD